MEDKKLNKGFSDYISEEALSEIMNQTAETVTKMTKGLIVYAIFQIRDKEIKAAQELIQRIAAIIDTKQGFIPGIISSIIVVTFGFPLKEDDKAIQNQEAAVTESLDLFKEDVKVVYGTEEGYYGNLNIVNGYLYTPMLREIGEKLSQLSKLKFGASKRL